MTSVIDPTSAVGTAAIPDPPPPYANPPVAALNPEGRVPTAVPPIVFALTPAQAVADLYDYSKAKDAKIYKTATDSLNTKHNGTIATLRPMLDELLMRAKDYNWNSLIMIKDNEAKMCKHNPSESRPHHGERHGVHHPLLGNAVQDGSRQLPHGAMHLEQS